MNILGDLQQAGQRKTTDVLVSVKRNCQITIHKLSEVVQISYGSVQFIITEDLVMRRVSAKFVPKLLSADQKDTQISFA